MGFIIGLLTFILVLDCVVMVFLVLIQLPKKEAGAGLAFGGAATDALFGAGSGNVLTKITKYAAGIFFILAVLLTVLQSKFQSRGRSELGDRLQKSTATSTVMPPASTPQPSAPATPGTNVATPAAPDIIVPTNLAAPPAGPAEQPALPTPPASPATNVAPAPNP